MGQIQAEHEEEKKSLIEVKNSLKNSHGFSKVVRRKNAKGTCLATLTRFSIFFLDSRYIQSVVCLCIAISLFLFAQKISTPTCRSQLQECVFCTLTCKHTLTSKHTSKRTYNIMNWHSYRETCKGKEKRLGVYNV